MVVSAVIAGIFLYRVFGGVDPTVRFFDDFFYYVKPAKNLVDGAGSTYFPGEHTNGYHPLWFLWLAFLWLITGGGTLFFGLVDVSLMLLMLGFFFLYQRFLRRVTGTALPAAIGAALAAIPLATIATAGVELALTVFAAALLLDVLTRKPLAQQGLKDAAIVGLLAAGLVLSRLDAAILAPGLVVAVGRRWNWKMWAAFAAGTSPVAMYFAFNILVYGHTGTTSMTAKSLAVYWPPNLHSLTLDEQMSAAGMIILLAVVVVIGLARRIENADMRRIAVALAVTPLLQLLFHTVFSGWMLFPWYFYLTDMMLGLGAALISALVASRWPRTPIMRWALIPASLVAVVVAAAGVFVGIRPNSHQAEIAVLARQLQQFASERPGVYAMGDAAGTPGWIMRQPIVHLEGLMMSHDFINRIRQRQPLDRVFRDYHVSFYVAVWSVDIGNGCRRTTEPGPLQSSPRSPHMEMTICAKPIAVIAPGPIYQVRIYRIDPNTGQAV
ncbi:hypothetical protein BOH72_08215 [Mycobacterium sp. WY10]|nr:hypothetical protein BOH72_08215 [Mycobacterium sp. WY10]